MTVSSEAETSRAVTRRSPGRPRTDGHDERIIDAALELLERGEEVTVGRVVAVSGVSRAAIYRRWPSMTHLLAAALDRGREPLELSLEGDLLENLVRSVTGTGSSTSREFSEERFRLRLRLAISDQQLAHAYWSSHVARRRRAMVALLQAGIDRGILRDDIDIDACIDLVNGAFYYQVVVRGASFTDPGVIDRCQAAVRVAWRGMLRHPDAAPGPDDDLS